MLFISKRKTELFKEIYNWKNIILLKDTNNNLINEDCFDLINKLLQKTRKKELILEIIFIINFLQ